MDAIFDTGKSFNDTISKADNPSKFIFVTLFARRGMKYPKQLIYGTKTYDNSYVVFPWDKLEFKNNFKLNFLKLIVNNFTCLPKFI